MNRIKFNSHCLLCMCFSAVPCILQHVLQRIFSVYFAQFCSSYSCLFCAFCIFSLFLSLDVIYSKWKITLKDKKHFVIGQNLYLIHKDCLKNIYLWKQGKDSLQKRGYSINLSESKRNCLFCKENHTLDMCKKFSEKPHKEKKSFFFSNYLCYGCGVSSNHKVKDCRYKKSCKVCSGHHLTCFHKEPTSQQERVTANCINVCGETDESTCSH